jgi:hypothetical protein
MRTHLLASGLLALALSSFACGEGTEATSTDAGTKPSQTKIRIDISGTVQLHPIEKAWRESAGGPGPAASLAGTTVAIEDAILALANKPPLATATLDETGAFSFTQVDVTNVTLAVVGSLTDPNGVYMTSGYGLYTGRPTEALGQKPVYVLTKAFVAHLQTALGSSEPDLSAGDFVFGAALEASQQGIAGAMFDTGDGVRYLSDDLSSANGTATGATGAFLFFPNGTTREHTMTKGGYTFPKKNVGSRPGAVLSSIFEGAPSP